MDKKNFDAVFNELMDVNRFSLQNIACWGIGASVLSLMQKKETITLEAIKKELLDPERLATLYKGLTPEDCRDALLVLGQAETQVGEPLSK